MSVVTEFTPAEREGLFPTLTCLGRPRALELEEALPEHQRSLLQTLLYFRPSAASSCLFLANCRSVSHPHPSRFLGLGILTPPLCVDLPSLPCTVRAQPAPSHLCGLGSGLSP